MGEISSIKRIRNYYRIYEQIYECETISVCDIAKNTQISRNTVAKYLKEMYENQVLIGPEICMNPATNYKEYVYLMNFADPYKAYRGLRGFPHVLYCAVACGQWNIMVVTDRLIDFSRLGGFQEMIFWGVRGYSYTPRVEYVSWQESFRKIDEYIVKFTPNNRYEKCSPVSGLPWKSDQWKLFDAFHSNMKKTVTPLLKKIEVRYETYTAWKRTLNDYCTIHTGFYPEGYNTYMHYCFLFTTCCERSVRELFSFFPTTPFVMEVGNKLLVFISVMMPDIVRKLFCTIIDMKTIHMITHFNQAATLFHAYNRRG